MKIHSNPNFPRVQPERAVPHNLPIRRERVSDTLKFVSELQARNTRALKEFRGFAPQERLSAVTKIERERPRERHSTRLTGPPIEVPGGHVHSISSRCTATR